MPLSRKWAGPRRPAHAGWQGRHHSHPYKEELMMRFTGRRSKAAGVAATAAVAAGALVLFGGGGGTPHSAMRAHLAGSDALESALT
jgi:diacylglycerol kinase family enzyme